MNIYKIIKLKYYIYKHLTYLSIIKIFDNNKYSYFLFLIFPNLVFIILFTELIRFLLFFILENIT